MLLGSSKPDQAAEIMRRALPGAVLRQKVEAATCSAYWRLMHAARSPPLSKQGDPLPEKTQSSASLGTRFTKAKPAGHAKRYFCATPFALARSFSA